MKSHVAITINNELHELEIVGGLTLLELLRDALNIQSVHSSCFEGECGACTVLLDGQAVCSCLTLAAQADGKQVITLEGLIKNGKPHPLITAFDTHKAIQCGYCSPGMIMTAYALINGHDHLTEETIRSGIEGNICRCTGYVNIIKAIRAAEKAKKEGLWW